MKVIKRPVKPVKINAQFSSTSRPAGAEFWRVNLLLVFIFIAIGGIFYNLFKLTYIEHSGFVQTAKSQYGNPSAYIAGRGNIYFSNLIDGTNMLAAANRTSFFVYANNKQISSPKNLAEKIAPILNLNAAIIETSLSQKDKNYNVLAKGITSEQAAKIKALKETGLAVASEVERFYPANSLAGHVLGFVGLGDKQRSGQYGVESFYDEYLGGEKKSQDIWGNKTFSDFWNLFNIFSKKETTGNSAAGNSSATFQGSEIVLSLDKNIQSFVEARLGSLLKKWNATGGSIIVQDPNSGEILAMASSPSFDPNNYSVYQLGAFVNSNVQQVFEPGSSFKPITMSAAIDTGAVTPETIYNDTGEVVIADRTIKNYDEKAHGVQTMRQVLERSLNTGAIFAQNRAGDDAFLNYVVGFGFGQKAGVDLSGEVSGNISNLYTGRKINFATASYGQGIAVTSVQLINAYSAIANGGKLMWPHAVKEIIRPDGTKIEIKPKIIGQPITEKTTLQIKSMLVDVVEKGFDKARIKGYDVAGKTGTAQIPDPKGGYLGDNQFIHDFVGFAPAYNPKFTILIKMDKPRGIKFAADSLSPVFGDVARFLINYFKIPPTR